MLKLHEMIIDSENREIHVGKEISIDTLQIVSIDPVEIWDFDRYLSQEERNKIDSKRLGTEGSLIKMRTGTLYYVVMESKNYIMNA